VRRSWQREQHGPRIGDRAVSESRAPEDARTFLRATFARLDGVLSGGVHLEVEHVFVDGETAIMELYSTSTTNEGAPVANRYCWICRFDGDSIVTVRVYLDSTMVMYTVLRNETPAQNA
jgi:ketosteroid isomerase-like protein